MKNRIYSVTSVKWTGHVKRLTLDANQYLTVPRSACISYGDRIRISDGDAWVLCKNGEAQILPSYIARDTLQLGGIRVELLIKEITELGEHQAYGALANFHYRGHAIHGRTARLVARTIHPTYPKVIGYIELATPFYMNKARASVLNAPFRLHDISWKGWDMPTQRRYIHLVARIARCVVYPEFRGLGLGQLLVQHACKFARKRWQVAGLLPYFIEISADMLKYVPFAEKAGMMFVGETEGNLNRVHKDMEYLIRNVKRVKGREIVSEESCGIVDQQVARMDRAICLMEREGLSSDELVRRLRNLSRESVLREFALFHGIVSLPKPTYLKGLGPQTSRFLRRRVNQMGLSNGRKPPELFPHPLAEPIVLTDVTITFASRVRRTRHTHAVQQAFDISPDEIKSTVVTRLSVEIQPGEIILIVGPSGSGKTTILEFLKRNGRGKVGSELQGRVQIPKGCRVGTFQKILSKRPLVEVLGKHGIESALHLLGLAGLSEPALYLKRFDELSKGQQYRAMLANLISTKTNVWFADEFCAFLDPVTANVVAHNVQKTARKLGITVVAAAPHCESFLFSLRPDKVVCLTSAWEYRVLSGSEYAKAVDQARKSDGTIPRIRLLQEFFKPIRSGQKRSTIRLGRKWFKPGQMVLDCDSQSLLVNVSQVEHKYFSDLTEQDAHDDGSDNLRSLKKLLRSIYPNISNQSPITVVRFEPSYNNSETHASESVT